MSQPIPETITMDPEDMIRKYPDDIPQPQICEILNVTGVADKVGHVFDPSNYNKKQLMKYLTDNEDIVFAFFGANLREARKELEAQDEAISPSEELLEENEDISEDEVLVVTEDMEDNLSEEDEETEIIHERDEEEEYIEMTKDEIQSELDRMEKIDELDKLKDVSVYRYQVRYIGPRGQIRHSVTSTFSSHGYKFPQNTWVDVEEIDFKRKYLPSVRNSLNARNEPHWQVRVQTIAGKFVDFFVEGVKEVLRIKPKRLKDVKHVTETRLQELHKYEIQSIHELLRTPKPRLEEILGLDKGTVSEMLEHARRSTQ